MAIPDYQSLMLPVLKLASDGAEHRISDVVDALAVQLKLTDAEREELLPKGKQPTFNNRVHWAKTYLVKAKLLVATRFAHFKITERGRSVLADNVQRIDKKFLTKFDEFNAFVGTVPTGVVTPLSPDMMPKAAEEIAVSESTPDELLRATIKEVESALAAELIARICVASPAFFERLVVDLLLKMGYGGSRSDAGRAIGKSGDGGIDGVIDQDQLGLDRIYLQAKRYDPDNPVGEPDIQKFCGSLGAKKAAKGVFLTTSYFTKPAATFAEHHPYKIVLIDGDLLARLMIHHSVGVRIVETMHYKKIDDEYFPEE
ncbi:restriction endonuclease [Bradyrhizobium japonicum]|uniref:restriction endonuclease n=1 Tax=Bradyrhizobium japonicum TaxID=375 RepID=UPI0005780F9B|nr:restriction endonuclease [Bradyrhizobium japonicum]